MYFEVLYESKTAGNRTNEICKFSGPLDFQAWLDAREKLTCVGRKFIKAKPIAEMNYDVVEWMQTISPCMFGGFLDWDDYRARMFAAKKADLEVKPEDLNEQSYFKNRAEIIMKSEVMPMKK